MSSDRPHGESNERAGISRRELMKIAACAGASVVLPAETVEAFGASTPLLPRPTPAGPIASTNTPKEWTGYSNRLGKYYLASGYPDYDPHPRYLGELQGSWHEIGKQYGERAGATGGIQPYRPCFEGSVPLECANPAAEVGSNPGSSQHGQPPWTTSRPQANQPDRRASTGRARGR